MDATIDASFSMNSVRPLRAFVRTDGDLGKTISLPANVSVNCTKKKFNEEHSLTHSYCSYLEERNSNGIFDHFLCRRNHFTNCGTGSADIHSV